MSNYRPAVDMAIKAFNLPPDDATQRDLHTKLEAWWAGLTVKERLCAHFLLHADRETVLEMEQQAGPGTPFKEAPDFVLDLMRENLPAGYELVTEGGEETVVVRGSKVYRGENAFARALDGDEPDEVTG